VPVIAMSARNDEPGAIEAGANGFLAKPFPLAAVRAQVQELMDA
jgi:DNA-binding response OmpR family regulator